MFGVVSPRHRYAVGDLSLVEPGADFIAPLREDRSAAAVAEDLASQAGTAPIRSPIVRKLLELYKHPNPDFVNYVCDGLRSGFDIGVKENLEGFELDNSKTAKEWMVKVDEWLASELAAERLLGPYGGDSIPHPRAQISPLGTAHKKCYDVGVVKRRVIYNLSSGPGRCREESVNGGTYQEPSVQYDTVEDAANVLRRYGTSAFLAKSDAKEAFRQLPVAPSAYHRLGVNWRGRTYFDTRVPFGLRMAPFIYASFSDAVRFIVQKRVNTAVGIDNCVLLTLLDDFLVIGRTKAYAETAFRILLDTFIEIGLPFVDSKTESPRQRIEFLGVLFFLSRSSGWHMGLPADKHADLRGKLLAIATIPSKRSIRKHALLSVAGSLGFVHPIFPAGRPWCSEMFRLAHAGGYKALDWQHSTSNLRADCRSWLRAISLKAPSIPLNTSVPSAAHLIITGGAAGTEGYGAYCTHGSFWSPWQQDLVAKQPGVSSTLQGLFCAVVSIRLWGSWVPRGSVLEYWTDNECMVDDLRKGRTSITPINSLIIQISHICINSGIIVRFCWASREVPSQQCADCLSRNHQVEFLRKFKEFRLGTAPPPSGTPTSEAELVHSSLRW